jgi:hypothetical protein
MASERQIEANRRNAKKSKGPKSKAGKKRSSNNAYQHGLSVPMLGRSEVSLKSHSREFADGATDPEILRWASEAAAAQLELERIRSVQVAMIEGDGNSSSPSKWCLMGEDRQSQMTTRQNEAKPCKENVSGSGSGDPAVNPSEINEKEWKPDGYARTALPLLIQTSRYEKRAIGQRNRAIGKIVSIRTSGQITR